MFYFVLCMSVYFLFRGLYTIYLKNSVPKERNNPLILGVVFSIMSSLCYKDNFIMASITICLTIIASILISDIVLNYLK